MQKSSEKVYSVRVETETGTCLQTLFHSRNNSSGAKGLSRELVSLESIILGQPAGFCYASAPAPAQPPYTHFCFSDQARYNLDPNVERLTDDLLQKKASDVFDCCSNVSECFTGAHALSKFVTTRGKEFVLAEGKPLLLRGISQGVNLVRVPFSYRFSSRKVIGKT